MAKKDKTDKPKTNGFFGDEIIKVRKARFVDGETIGAYLRGGGTKGQLRAGIKSGSIEIESPETADK